ncbi:Uncharacterised protein [Yersinia intermedia]|uniref:hypothetical protein n=1 Tax=Yersinia intermedia TaxID=631 RepID=UPI0005E13552|nr:hypothetical protein [Yersinia intermedia]CNJ31681.1 Uncharacterised protein [Yersinia intermedia]
MAYLRDMEELIGTIEDVNMQSYMREALRCYMTDAHRACIIMSFITIHENIYTKLDRLSLVNSTAKKIYDEITPLKENQAVFEKEMIDRLSKENIISKLDASFVTLLGNLRNKSAHPSGHSPSAEEARYIFSESISRFLSKPILSAHQVSDEILESLGGGNLFPTLKVSDYATIVQHELSRLSLEGLPYLLNKLIYNLDNSNETIKINALRFILGMGYEGAKDEILASIKKILIEKQAHKTERENFIILLVSCNYKLLEDLSPPTYIRLNEVIIKNNNQSDITDSTNKTKNPLQNLKSISKLSPEKSKINFMRSASSIINKFKYNTNLYPIVEECSWMMDELFEKLLDQAKNYDFATANNFAKFIINADDDVSKILTSKQCFSLLVGIYKANTYGATHSERIIVNEFKSIPLIKEKALTGVLEEKGQYQDILKEISGDDSLHIDTFLPSE